MAKFPSDEWAKEYVEKLNSNPAYGDAGKTWDDSITFVVQPDETYKDYWYLYLNLKAGKCIDSAVGKEEGDVPKSSFKYMGKYSNWVKLIKGEIDPIQGLMTGKFKLDGSMMKIMRYTNAAKEMVNTAKMVDTQF
ncbi:MAG: SCP2 sterol-binding domain-containing protein [Candidatus Thermoplasmatota archaeon]|jgi:putative sterol carrier protein|uniref:SCP2 sterol-binding domain-containing protein n=1 Tax=Ferroplasma sp. Type II TaxID=261388 RepID=UPI000389638E|nr:SCP2 sterol-binding domain-containing protein [Ferroplasma sp. Type II]EQB70073.1 MAG: sterol carrier protein [Ferroplasma sp. Type II]EQB70079.1 MAG: sterol carrier protein [Ferroplasma sp. Type II]MCL4310838.1 SCP2 sterol-binding domain-containing protein [Candidatus Thermoplasmatota archaeon]HII82201.1 sterol carrier protein [Ferroplasma sp.]